MLRKKYRTGFLFNATNSLVGMGSVLNIAGNYFSFNGSRTGEEADRKAIENDWGVNGQDELTKGSESSETEKPVKSLDDLPLEVLSAIKICRSWEGWL